MAGKKRDPEFTLEVQHNVYPQSECRFPEFKVGVTYQDARAGFPLPIEAPEGATNILLVMLDDVGFGWPSVFGGLDALSPVSMSYADKRPFVFAGTIERVHFDFDVDGVELPPEEKLELKKRMD
jgi:hypothetical protein